MKFLKKHAKFLRFVVVSALSLTVLIAISLCFKETWIFGINVYQRFISPHKGYHCAYAAWHNDISCSNYGEEVIKKNGVFNGMFLLRQRFAECHFSSLAIRCAIKNGGECNYYPAHMSLKEEDGSLCCCCDKFNGFFEYIDDECNGYGPCANSKYGQCFGCNESPEPPNSPIPPGKN